MEIKNIYEDIHIEASANYQVKVKGPLKSLRTLLKSYNPTSVTSETTDNEHPIYMITLNNITQPRLFALLTTFVHYRYPIISIICTRVTPKKTDVVQNDDDPPFAMTAS
mgnify:CR=1 FL=1